MKIRRWKNQEHSNNNEESLKMKVAHFSWFPLAMDKSTDMGDNANRCLHSCKIWRSMKPRN
jgi:hypothetical protein